MNVTNLRIVEDITSGGRKFWTVERKQWFFWRPVDKHFGKRYSAETDHNTLAEAEALVRKLSEPGRDGSRRIIAEYEIKNEVKALK